MPVLHLCEKCEKVFKQKSHLIAHLARKNPCKKDDRIEKIVEKKVQEILARSVVPIEYMNPEKEYLQSIKTENGYKRVSISPLRYAGGKSKAIGLIIENFPELKTKKIVSPFFGGGSLEIVLATKLGYEVVGYDVFGMLVNFWQQLLTNPVELADELSTLIPDTETFTRNRHILLHYWDIIKPNDLVYNTRNKLELTDDEKKILIDNSLLQAVYYYYNMQLSYGPMFLGWPSSLYLKQYKYDKIVERIRDSKLGNISIKCESFETTIPKHKDDFLFLDPPYYLGADSKMFKGMYPNCNFAIHHNKFDHRLLCELLKKHTSGFFITYNDCPTIREMYADYKQIFPSWQYTYGQGETRIGKNREDGTQDNKKESHEIFIICPPQ
jgi:DNA adenine methylase